MNTVVGVWFYFIYFITFLQVVSECISNFFEFPLIIPTFNASHPSSSIQIFFNPPDSVARRSTRNGSTVSNASSRTTSLSAGESNEVDCSCDRAGNRPDSQARGLQKSLSRDHHNYSSKKSSAYQHRFLIPEKSHRTILLPCHCDHWPTVSRVVLANVFQAYVCTRPLPNSLANPRVWTSADATDSQQTLSRLRDLTKHRDVTWREAPSQNSLKTCQFLRRPCCW